MRDLVKKMKGILNELYKQPPLRTAKKKTTTTVRV